MRSGLFLFTVPLIFCFSCAPCALAQPAAEKPVANSTDPGLLVIYNTKVPFGAELARSYAEMRRIPETRLLGLPMPLEETLTMESYQKELADPIRDKLRKQDAPARILLCCYGVPIFIQDGERIRCVDRMLSLLHRQAPLKDSVVENPFWRRIIESGGGLPLLVSRLDAPSPVQARRMLEGWKQHASYGPWKRYLLDLPSEELRGLIETGLFVQRSADPASMPTGEIQCLEADGSRLSALLSGKGEGFLAPGAFVLIRDSGVERTQHRNFRSMDQSSAAAACMLGAGFFLGSQAPRRKDYEDFFEAGHFFERLASGETFIQAAYGALANLGGSFLILGDPLSQPFGEGELDRFKALYESGQVEGSDPELLRRHAENKLWWVLRGINEDWGNGRLEVAIVKARAAALMRRDFPPYSEVLCSFLYQTGDYPALSENLKAFPAQKIPYYQDFARRMKEKLPGAAPGKK